MDCLIWSVIYDSRLVNFFIRYSSFCEGSRVPIDPMPGIYQLSVDQLAAEANEIKSLAIPAVLFLGIPEKKAMSGGIESKGVIQQVV